MATRCVKKTFQYGSHEVTLETGAMARQANGSVLVNMGETILLVTVVVACSDQDASRDFFPLTVNYQEKAYAIGKIPGGYFKREGRPSEKEILISRLIDRPTRPLFPEGFHSEVQIVATLLSLDPEISPDIPAILGASAAIGLAGIPFGGPLAAARVGFSDGAYLLNPLNTSVKYSELDLVVAGTADAVLMVESEAKELSEEVMLGAVMFGHEQMQVAVRAITEFVEEAKSVGVARTFNWQAPVCNQVLVDAVAKLAAVEVKAAYQIADKKVRGAKLAALEKEVAKALLEDTTQTFTAPEVKHTFHDLTYNTLREQILRGEARIDGRDNFTVRPITVDVGVLPRTHGSALFTRGETQALVVATLGVDRDAQTVDDLMGEYKEGFMLHYNFPPYSVGEVGQMGSPKRREIGHGKLAKRALEAVIPSSEHYPYVIRIVSEITESNGSSSMATVCGTSLALMDAGVPVKAPVAGIAMGLVKEGERFAVLTDILGDEDHLGDMDFKVAGTEKGVTALQMDIKINGITESIMRQALAQAKEGRLRILTIMNRALQTPREEISQYAPRIITMKIDPEKIRDVIGKGGATIRELTESTSTTIDISDDGVIKIASVDMLKGEEAKRRIEQLVADVEIGKLYQGKIVKLMDFGAFVEILPGRQGLVHISHVANHRIENIFEHLQEGQNVTVKVLEIDRQGRIRLSMKEI